jgi:hypothetical protein
LIEKRQELPKIATFQGLVFGSGSAVSVFVSRATVEGGLEQVIPTPADHFFAR